MTIRSLMIEVKEAGKTHYVKTNEVVGTDESSLLMLNQIFIGDLHASLNKFKGYGNFSIKSNYDGTYTYTLNVKVHDYAGNVKQHCRKTYIVSTSDDKI